MQLLKISLTISILGIFALLLISEYSEIPLQNIKDLNKDQLETKVRVQGDLISIKETPGLYLLKLKQSNALIPVVIFKEEILDLKKNSQIEVTGTLTEYNNELEILADTITQKTK
jgi:RecJ-like exonuclease